jgi:hypothetical protein
MSAKRPIRAPESPKKGASRRDTHKRVASKKLAVSFEGGLADRIQRAATEQTAGNVSAWLAEAARERLRLQAARTLLHEYEAEHGVITKDELAQIEREWPRG